MAEIIIPQRSVAVVFSLAPACNAIGSLSLLDLADELTGMSEWVYRTKATLSTEQLRTNQLVLQDIFTHLEDRIWPSFPDWVDHLAIQDPTDLRDRALEVWLWEVRAKVEREVPGPAALLADRASYLALAADSQQAKGHPYDPSFWEEMHHLLNDPHARQTRMVEHLRDMWDGYLAPEWEAQLPVLQDSILAFESLDFSGLTAVEALGRVVLRAQIPQEGRRFLESLDQMVLIPSAHTGPYLVRLGGLNATAVRFLFGARIPEGAAVRTPALSRSELLMRLSALANDTRLSILELLARQGEMGTPEITDHLALSQSAAARHLEHLTATGYLVSWRHQGTNHFRLNPDRIDDTFNALKDFCK
jgi:DNA-binding transcriptional ArsR family regulator